MNRHHKRRRLATLAACVGTTAALAALGSAGSALASVTCRAPGYGSGSSFQKTALVSVFLTSTGWGLHSNCSVAPTSSTITYTATSSGKGLEEFGNATGKFIPERDPTAFASETGTKDTAGQVLDWFVGTDDAPTPRELGEAAIAAGTLHNQKAEITIPVAQAPVAVMLSLPPGCKILSGSAIDLNNKTLPQLWEGTNAPSGEDPGGIQPQNGYAINTWGAFLSQLEYTKITEGSPAAGQFLDEGGETGCGVAIKPQVRQTSSGTSFAYKSYLSQIYPSVWSGFAADAPTWPTSAVVTTNLKTGSETEHLLNDTGGHLVQNTAANPGSVGYANAADAASVSNGGFTNAASTSTFSTGAAETHSPSHQILWAEVQNDGTSLEGATYTDPVVGGSIGNCETTKILPAEEGFPYSYTDSWYGLLASDPNISASASPADYSICALTYDLVFHHYSNKHLFGGTETAHEVANTTRDLFEYIINQGQVDVQSHDYTRYPTGFQSHVANAVNPGIGF